MKIFEIFSTNYFDKTCRTLPERRLMLVLSRKRDEKILLQMGEGHEDIELTVVRIDQNKVRLGIKAGDEVTILRSELIDSQNKL